MKGTHFALLLLVALNLENWPVSAFARPAFGAAPALSLLLVAYVALEGGPFAAFVAGWAAGIAHDATSGAAFGTSSLIWAPSAFALAKTRVMFHSERFFAGGLFALAFSGFALVAEALAYSFSISAADPRHFAAAGLSAVATALLAPFVFAALRAYNRRFKFIPRRATV